VAVAAWAADDEQAGVEVLADELVWVRADQPGDDGEAGRLGDEPPGGRVERRRLCSTADARPTLRSAKETGSP